jgi:spermidine synthase
MQAEDRIERARASPSPASMAAASLLFFLSGAVGLIYEVVWFRRFAHAFGSSGLAMAAVIASFLGGLGLGAWWIGRAADRSARPLLWYAACEAAIGLIALLVPHEIAWLSSGLAGVEAAASGLPGGTTLFRLGLAFAILAPPCILMGGTLPLLLRFFAPEGGGLGRTAGWLYALNALGAAAGCFAAGFWLLPGWGLHVVGLAAAAASMALGGAAAAVAIASGKLPSREAAAPSPTEAGEEAGAHGLAPSFAAIAVAAALTGAAALALEVVWTRQLALVLGSTTYAFTAALAVFLAGIGIGSLAAGRILPRGRTPPYAAPAVIAAIAVTSLGGKMLLPALASAAGLVQPLRASLALDAGICLAASAAIELLPALGMGFLFPLLVQLAGASGLGPARAAGSLYALNTAGSIAGAALGTLAGIPLLGTAKTTAAALGAYSFALFLVSPPLARTRDQTALFLLLLAALSASLIAVPEGDPLATNLGLYLYREIDEAERPDEVLFFREGTHANVLVTGTGASRSLRVNGKVDASTLGDMPMQLGLAYFPFFLAPESRSAFVIGHGSGTTPGALLCFDGVEVTCAEIEPSVVAGAALFAAVNHEPWRSPRFKLVLDDGRSHLARSDATFDLILSEPSNPWMAGAGNLFTLEFYRTAAARLAPAGILAQWIQTYRLTLAEYALVVRTLRAVFPHALLVRISSGDTMVLASREPLAPRLDASTRAQEVVGATAAAHADLLLHFGTADVRSLLLRHVLLDGAGLDRLLAADGQSGLHTDINLRLEFDAPRRLFEPLPAGKGLDARILDAVDARWFSDLASRAGAGREQAGAVHDLARLFGDGRGPEPARSLIDLGLRLDPGHLDLLAERLAALPEEDAAPFATALEALAARGEEGVPDALGNAGKKLFEDGRYERAARVFERITRLFPHSATAWTNLGNTLAAAGRAAEAEAAFDRAVELDPLSRFARRSSALAARAGKQPEAAPARDPVVEQGLQRYEREGREVFDRRRDIAAACRLRPGMAVADVGAGTGIFTRLFAPLVGPEGKVYAVDISRELLDHVAGTCREQGLGNVAAVAATVDDSGLEPGSIDLAFVCDAYHHFDRPASTLASLHRALRPGGELILIDFKKIPGVSSEWVMGHVRGDQAAFTAEVEAAGFRKVEELELLKESYFIRFVKYRPP